MNKINPPEYLNERAKDIFNRVSDEIISNGGSVDTDIELIAAYAAEVATYEDVTSAIGNNKIYKSPNGYPIMNPLYTIRNQCLKNIKELGALLGLGLKSKNNMSEKPSVQETKISKLEVLLNKPKVS